MPSPIIARADALMQRRRQSDNEFDDIPILTDAIDQIDDIPVLTEIEPVLKTEDYPELIETAVEPLADTHQEVLPEDPSSIDSDLRDELIQDLTSRIESRIKAVLPEIISTTIREFLAEQEMIENS
ncbi:MAG: hypothetical protein HGA71_10905 [Azonexaceae bacterium]|nr:hypothetical protein [Azonexaceae bacterium]